jgi:hypothetical protein
MPAGIEARSRHLDRHRQRVERLVHGQCMADQRAHHGLAGHHRVHQRLTAEQQVNVAVHAGKVRISIT